MDLHFLIFCFYKIMHDKMDHTMPLIELNKKNEFIKQTPIDCNFRLDLLLSTVHQNSDCNFHKMKTSKQNISNPNQRKRKFEGNKPITALQIKTENRINQCK